MTAAGVVIFIIGIAWFSFVVDPNKAGATIGESAAAVTTVIGALLAFVGFVVWIYRVMP